MFLAGHLAGQDDFAILFLQVCELISPGCFQLGPFLHRAMTVFTFDLDGLPFLCVDITVSVQILFSMTVNT